MHSDDHPQWEHRNVNRGRRTLLKFPLKLSKVLVGLCRDARNKTLNLNAALGLTFPHSAFDASAFPEAADLNDFRCALNCDFQFSSLSSSNTSQIQGKD
jgi:hypothetical protein